ncbi:TetR/AcrR family transcriptional regulator [Streptomyces sp. COG21]|uniref:TetR/AcrR family transcriptional regulator n=1 Tax=Streptomyces sp. COG21 TaxID=2838872 RepID=UPI001BE94325|nr:TetR family transcriptional regulator C-terminal domain-containing protein [Streptomyces sp. COG21]MBT3112647.1 TetR family transcriptional regulator C-terminal domain-containing protein [Streptomyces sp. CYG20]
MPRKVDHRERRELLADALMRLAATQGLEGVSLRHVAAEAGVSTGMVQHYFRTKDEMMTFAFGMVEDRIRARCEAADTPAAPRELVRALLLQILPLDDTRRLEGHVGLAFLAYAAVKPAMRAGVSEGAGRMRGFITQQLRQGRGGRRRPRPRGDRPDGARGRPRYAAAVTAVRRGGGGGGPGRPPRPDLRRPSRHPVTTSAERPAYGAGA